MGDSGLLGAIAQWVATLGVPAMFLAWYRLREDLNALRVEIATLKAKVAESESVRQDVNEMKHTMTEVRIIVGELKVRMDHQTRVVDQERRDRRSSDRGND